jgi:drug/metabolite transporter (DMT)-like permease
MEANFTIVAVSSAVFAAIANILARTLLRDVKSRDVLGVNFLVMALTLLIFSPLFFYFSFSWQAAGLVLLVGTIDTAANYFYFKSFERSEASTVTPILSLAPGFTFLFGWLFLDDIVSWPTFAITAGIILLIIIFSFEKKQIKEFHKETLLPALASSFLFGISAVPSKALLDNLDAINSPTLYMFRAGLIALLAFVFFQNPIKKLSQKQYKLIFIRGLFVIAQWVLLYYALSLGNAGVAVTLANMTPIFVFIFGFFILKEKLTYKKFIAASLVIILSLPRAIL